MCLIKFNLIYYLIGILCSAFFELLINKFKASSSNQIKSVTWSDRFWYVSLWPSFTLFFFITIVKTLKNKRND
jgi:hypothetical protein